MRGADRAAYLQGLLTNDIVALAQDSGCYAAYLTQHGRMITDLEVLNLGDALLLDVPASRGRLMADRLNELIFTEDVQVLDRTEEWGHVSVHGPRSVDVVVRVLQSLGASQIPTPQELESWVPYRNVRFELNGTPGVLVRRDDFDVIGCGIYLPPTPGVPGAVAAPEWGAGWRALGDALQSAGAVAISADAAETLRIEAGRPAFGIDLDEDTIPLEAGLENRAISFTKGCYVGQEVIFRIVSRGHGRVARRLVGLTLETGPPGVEPGPVGSLRGATLWHDDKEVGRVTSAAFSPAVEKVIALGYVHRDLASPAIRVLVSADGDKIAATVSRVIGA